jgi:hypothetical protein
MKQTRTFALAGIIGLVSLGLAAGCSSSSSSNGTGKGGSGGSATGNGGSPGTGGSGTGTGGSTSDAGAAVCNSHTPVVPTSTTIDDFSFDGGMSAVISSPPYAYAATGLTKPTVSTSSAGLMVTVATGPLNLDGGANNNYAGWGLPFDKCTDASAYSGVKFHIGGTLNAMCTIQFSFIFSEDASFTDANGFASCPASASCYPPAFIFTLPPTATPADVTVKFSDVTGGMPISNMVVKGEITNVQWQVNVPAAGCTGSVLISNIVWVP